MKLIINTPAAQRSSRGVSRYVSNVMKNLQWPGGIEPLIQPKSQSFGRFRELLEPGLKNSILWTPCHRGSIRAKHHVVTVHDCISIEYIYRSDARLPLYLGMMNILLNRAEAVVAISYATREAILRNFSIPQDRIEVIQSGFDPISPPAVTIEAKEKRPFVLFVTNNLPHKNTVATCRAWARSRGPREGIVLRVVGKIPEAARDACGNVALSLEYGLSDVELATAYRDCQFLIAPSLSEGHDLPVAEALALGADVLCSDIDVHREYFDGRVRFFDPFCEDAIVAALDNALWAPRPWFEPNSARLRCFADVAQDYTALFHRIEARY